MGAQDFDDPFRDDGVGGDPFTDPAADTAGDEWGSLLDGVPDDVATPMPAATRSAVKQRLLEDPRGLYSNPHTIDWTMAPITAMKLTIQYAEEALREVPAAVQTAIKAGVADAEKTNAKGTANLSAAFQTVFFSQNQLKHGFKGVVPELEARTMKLGAHLANYGQQLTAQGQLNAALTQLVATVDARATALEKVVGDREAAVAKRENQVGQRELNFKKRLAEFEARGFWGHFGHAFLSLSKSQMGAGFGILVAIGVLLLAGRGLMAFAR